MNTDEKNKKISIICLSSKGAEIALNLSAQINNTHVYIPVRLQDKLNTKPDYQGEKIEYFTEWEKAFKFAFLNSEIIVCIMASGIVVRALAPLIQSKYQDPAVLVIDEKGDFVISLLSGHIGGANEATREVASLIDAQAVITTSTDLHGKLAVDLLAEQMDAIVEPRDKIKTISRLLIEGEDVQLCSPWRVKEEISQNFAWQGWETNWQNKKCDLEEIQAKISLATVVVSPYNIPLIKNRDMLLIKPKNLFIGIGCRKNITFTELKTAVEKVLQEYALDLRCVKALASIDFKTQELAMQELAAWYKLPLLAISKEEILETEGSYEASDRVRKEIGVGGVCEPVAMISAGRGIILVPKQKCSKVTVSVAMEKSWWWDWGLETHST